MEKTALRDRIRATPLGPVIRDLVIIPYRTFSRRALARRISRVDESIFECPICLYTGIFVDYASMDGTTRHYAICPKCGSLERHRLQSRVLDLELGAFNSKPSSMLHFAPEKYFK